MCLRVLFVDRNKINFVLDVLIDSLLVFSHSAMLLTSV